MYFVFFFKQKTAYEMRISDWSSDVCSSDLLAGKRVRGKLVGKRVVPYDTRAEIAASEARQPPVIVWASDPVEAFFLQIQGSGRAQLPDGSVVRLAYADHNGKPYVSIGQWPAKKCALTPPNAAMKNNKDMGRTDHSACKQKKK